MLDACLDPELASEITLQPVRRHGVDAAVFFSDIVIPLRLAGVPVEIVAGRGPVLDSPIRSASDILRLRPIDPDALAPIREGVARTVAELGRHSAHRVRRVRRSRSRRTSSKADRRRTSCARAA